MKQITILFLGVVLLALFIPNQVHSQSTPIYNATGTTLAGQNASSSSNSSGASPVTTSTNITTTHGHADPLYSSSALILLIASILVSNACC